MVTTRNRCTKTSKAARRSKAKKRSLVIGNEHVETPEAAGGEEIRPSKLRKENPSSGGI